MPPSASPAVVAMWILAAATLVQLGCFVLPAAARVVRSRPRPTWSHWLSLHAWIVIFWALNVLVFWLSMQSATGSPLLSVLGDWVVAAQIAIMLAAAPLVFRANWNEPTVPVAPNVKRWAAAMICFIAANLLALFHSWLTLGQFGYAKAIVWTLMDCGAMFFYACIRHGFPHRRLLSRRRCIFCGPTSSRRSCC